MYSFQIFEVMFSLDSDIDTKNVLWILPVCMIVIPFVYFIRLKLFDKYVHGIDMEALAAELEYYKNKEQAQLDKAGVRVQKLTAEKVKGLLVHGLSISDFISRGGNRFCFF